MCAFRRISAFSNTDDLETVLRAISNYAVEQHIPPWQIANTFEAGICARAALSEEILPVDEPTTIESARVTRCE
jgi:hypothetical protein